MKVALGIHVGHDRGACIIIDGKVVASLANERIDRIKYSQSLQIPFETIDILLNYCNLNINDVNVIGLSGVAFEGQKMYNWYKSEFHNYYKCNHIPFYLVNHHEAHAYSAYYSSGLNNCLVFVFDGGGDFSSSMQEAETIYIGKDGKLTEIDRRLQNIAVRHMKDEVNYVFPLMPEYVQNLEMSLARKYSQITRLLGFGFGQEGKTMGLASYGHPLLDFSKLDYTNLNFSLTYKDIIKDFFIMQQKAGKDFREYIFEERENIASTVQSFIEHAILSIISNYTNKYNIRNICLAGGLFLNCLTNHKILEKCNLDNAFFLPASGDDGQALGCAYNAYIREFGYCSPFEIKLPYLGISYSKFEVKNAIEEKGLQYTWYNDAELASIMADYISKNKIVAIHRGKTELGPRALCHRSILANPTNPAMKDILNNRVKHREPFRPFAPTVIEEEQYEYFNLLECSPYMLLATTVKEKYQKQLCAITHVDKTARIQSVTKESDPFIHNLLLELKNKTGFPIVLNTSFNVAGQPIVERPADAIDTFLTNDIDVLVIENFIITK